MNVRKIHKFKRQNWYNKSIDLLTARYGYTTETAAKAWENTYRKIIRKTRSVRSRQAPSTAREAYYALLGKSPVITIDTTPFIEKEKSARVGVDVDAYRHIVGARMRNFLKKYSDMDENYMDYIRGYRVNEAGVEVSYTYTDFLNDVEQFKRTSKEYLTAGSD